MPQHRDSVSKTRLDALADAMFGVAMTLLVIDIRLPEAFDPKSGAELSARDRRTEIEIPGLSDHLLRGRPALARQQQARRRPRRP